MATTLPAAADLTGASVTEGQFKTALGAFLAFVSELQTTGANIASASTTNIGAATGQYVNVTGTTNINAFDAPASASNVTRIVRFSGALTIAHSANILLPGEANITTTAGDVGLFVHEGGGVWRCLFFCFIKNPLRVDPAGYPKYVIPTIGGTALAVGRSGSSMFEVLCGVAGVTGDALQIKDTSLGYTYLILKGGECNLGTGIALVVPHTYSNTTASAANMYIDSAGKYYRSTSSLKYKTDVADAEHGLEKVLLLRPVTYKGKNDGEQIFGGLIAEEVHAAGLTEFVQYAEDGSPDALAYGNMVSLAFKAIQELSAKNDALEARLAALEGA
jgi:hypothetical protein